MEDIFKPFFRGDRARTNHVRGSGLGLSLVKSIVDAHGGSVSVSSEVGKGLHLHRHPAHMNSRILLVEDEPGIVQVLVDLLEAEGHTVDTAEDGDTGLRMACSGSYDLLILDVMLPGLSGIEVCHGAREQGFDGAILMLTAMGRVRDRVKGLRSGADDYLAKPFDSDELIARVDALLRRSRNVGLTPVMRVEFGDVVADFSQGRFTKDGVPVNLTAKEAELLRVLINRRGQVISRAEILSQVWADQPFITPRTVDVHVAWLRQKIEGLANAPRHIITVRGEGYRFVK